MSEVSLNRLRPRARFGAWSSLLLQDGKDGCRSSPQRSRSEQSKTPDSVLIAFRNVLSPAVNEFLQ
jgi:hypothetical protein